MDYNDSLSRREINAPKTTETMYPMSPSQAAASMSDILNTYKTEIKKQLIFQGDIDKANNDSELTRHVLYFMKADAINPKSPRQKMAFEFLKNRQAEIDRMNSSARPQRFVDNR